MGGRKGVVWDSGMKLKKDGKSAAARALNGTVSVAFKQAFLTYRSLTPRKVALQTVFYRLRVLAGSQVSVQRFLFFPVMCSSLKPANQRKQ